MPFACTQRTFGPWKRNTWIGCIFYLSTASCPVNSVPLQRLNTLLERQHKTCSMLRKYTIYMWKYEKGHQMQMQMWERILSGLPGWMRFLRTLYVTRRATFFQLLSCQNGPCFNALRPPDGGWWQRMNEWMNEWQLTYKNASCSSVFSTSIHGIRMLIFTFECK